MSQEFAVFVGLILITSIGVLSFPFTDILSDNGINASESDMPADVNDRAALNSTFEFEPKIISTEEEVTFNVEEHSEEAVYEWFVDGRPEASGSVFVYQFNERGFHNVTLRASSEGRNNSISKEVHVKGFTLQKINLNSPVSESKPLEATVGLRNNFERSFEDKIIFRIFDNNRIVHEESKSVEVSGESQESIDFEWDGVPGTYNVSVYAGNTELSGVAEVSESPQIEINTINNTSPVFEGEKARFNVEARNIGGSLKNFNIHFQIAEEVTNKTIGLEAGEAQNLSFNWQTGSGDNGTYTAVVSSGSEEEMIDLVVNRQASFDVSFKSSNSPVFTGEEITAYVNVENNGYKGSREVNFSIGDLHTEERNLTLGEGESRTLKFNWLTGSDNGAFTAVAESGTSRDTLELVVEERKAFFDVREIETKSTIVAGRKLDLRVLVKNSGNKSGTQQIRMGLDSGEDIDVKELSLDNGGSEWVDFHWNTDIGEEGGYTLSLSSEDDVEENNVDIQPAPVPIGGGEFYQKKVCNGYDEYVNAPADLNDLVNALETASSGDTVYVYPEADINLGFDENSPSLEVPADVTLAGGRGCNGSSGARLYGEEKPGSDWIGSDTILLNEGSRLTGVRIEGPYPDREMNWLGEDHDYTDGVEVNGPDVEIDNNRIYGWPAAAVRGGQEPIHVHHNFIHDNDQSGLGYGVASSMWPSIIEYNRFNRNRHAVTGSGDEGEGYIVRNNTFGSEGIGGAGHKIDMHEDGNTGKAGSKIEVYRNTIKFSDAQAVYLRGEPRENSTIYDNWIYNTNDPCLSKNENGGYCAIRLTADDWSKLDYFGNHYGDEEPSCEIGAPRDSCT